MADADQVLGQVEQLANKVADSNKDSLTKQLQDANNKLADAQNALVAKQQEFDDFVQAVSDKLNNPPSAQLAGLKVAAEAPKGT